MNRLGGKAMVSQTVDERFQIGRVVQQTLNLCKDNFGVFALLTVIFSCVPDAIFALIGLGMDIDPEDTAAVIRGVPGESLVTGLLTIPLSIGLIQAAHAAWNGTKLTLSQSLEGAGRLFPGMFGMSFLIGLGVILGLILLVVPGVFLALVWSVAGPLKVLEGRAATEAMSRSADLTKNNRWAILGVYLIYTLICIAAAVVIAIPAVIVTFLTGGAAAPLFDVVAVPIMTGVAIALFAVGSAVIYRELVQIKEGGPVGDVGSVFT